jgi:hypothetical protein
MSFSGPGAFLCSSALEYKEKNQEGYEYSQFCLRYRAWPKTLDVALRQDHKAGEKLFVDLNGEINASKRLIKNLGKDHPHLSLIVVADGLYSREPFVEALAKEHMRFVLVAKEEDHKVLME